MATLTYSAIVTAVLSLMDENGGNYAFMNSDDAMAEVKSVIRQVTEPAVRSLHMKAPIAMLDSVSGSPSAAALHEKGGRYPYKISGLDQLIPGPGEFFRLVRMKMSSWDTPVSQLWWEDSVEYAKQSNKFLMGTKERPIAFLVHDGVNLCIEAYSSDDANDTLDEFLYVVKPSWSDNGNNPTIKISGMIQDACLAQIASDTFTALGETDKAQMMAAMAMRPINTFGGEERHYADNGNRVER